MPDPRATELARLSVRVEFEFILRSVTHEFKDLALTAGKKLASEGVSVHLDQFEDTVSEVRGSLVIEAAEGRSIHPDLIKVVMRNEEGKEARFAVGGGKGSRLQCGFAVGGGPQKFGRIADLRVTVPIEVHTESIDLDLRDVPLKR